MRAALLQMRAGIDPGENAVTLVRAIEEARAQGADMLFTPEMSGLIDRDRARAAAHLRHEDDDPVLAAVRGAAARTGLWVQLGSLAVRREDEARLANRAFLIDGAGAIRARYDKIHLFDVDLGAGESWRESAAYAPGARAVVADTPWGRLGLSICYDLRFGALYRALAEAGATMFAIPAAFTVPTGRAHWHVLLRARAIEAGAFVLAAAQGGRHADGRETYGHSLAVDPWGEVLCDMTDEGGSGEGGSHAIALVDLDPARVAEARARIPVAAHGRAFERPEAAA